MIKRGGLAPAPISLALAGVAAKAVAAEPFSVPQIMAPASVDLDLASPASSSVPITIQNAHVPDLRAVFGLCRDGSPNCHLSQDMVGPD